MSSPVPTAMSGLMSDKKFKDDEKPKKAPKAKVADVEAAYIPLDSEGTEEDKKRLREEEKSIMSRRKQTKDILEKWDPSLIATKARKGFEEDVKRDDTRLREIRKKLKK